MPREFDSNLLRRLEEISGFYTPQILSDVFLPFVNHGSPVSLRLVDWYCVNYVKKKKVQYVLQTPSGAEIVFDVATSYKSYLKSYRRRGFDVFRRFERITIAPEALKVASPTPIETTVAQLNFFKWMIDHDVLRQLQRDQKAVENSMVEAHRAKRLKRKRAAAGNDDDDKQSDNSGGGGAKAKRSALVSEAHVAVTVSREQRTNVLNF